MFLWKNRLQYQGKSWVKTAVKTLYNIRSLRCLLQPFLLVALINLPVDRHLHTAAAADTAGDVITGNDHKSKADSDYKGCHVHAAFFLVKLHCCPFMVSFFYCSPENIDFL